MVFISRVFHLEYELELHEIEGKKNFRGVVFIRFFWMFDILGRNG